MNGIDIFIDTNIALRLLGGDKKLAETLHLKQYYLSFINELELLSYRGISANELTQIKLLLDECIIIGINDEIKKHTLDFRIKYSLKLPDAIIAATATYLRLPLLTSDKDFKKISGLNFIFYE